MQEIKVRTTKDTDTNKIRREMEKKIDEAEKRRIRQEEEKQE